MLTLTRSGWHDLSSCAHPAGLSDMQTSQPLNLYSETESGPASSAQPTGFSDFHAASHCCRMVTESGRLSPAMQPLPACQRSTPHLMLQDFNEPLGEQEEASHPSSYPSVDYCVLLHGPGTPQPKISWKMVAIRLSKMHRVMLSVLQNQSEKNGLAPLMLALQQTNVLACCSARIRISACSYLTLFLQLYHSCCGSGPLCCPALHSQLMRCLNLRPEAHESSQLAG